MESGVSSSAALSASLLALRIASNPYSYRISAIVSIPCDAVKVITFRVQPANVRQGRNKCNDFAVAT
jgi:hypothetical protein